MNFRLRLPSRHDFGHDAQMLIAAAGTTGSSYLGLFMLLRSLYILRLGYGPEYLGIYYLVGSIAYMVMGIPSGTLSRRFGTKVIMPVGGAIMTTGMVLFPLTGSLPPFWRYLWPLISQFIITVGWSMVNVNIVPALMTATTQNNRHSAYATTSAIREVGTLAGTFIGGLLPGWFAALSHTSTDSPGPYQGALWIGALLGALSLIPLSRLKQDNVVVTTKVEATRAAFPFLPIALMVLYIYIRHMGWATCQAFCNPYMDVDLKLSAANIGLITSTGQIVAIIASLAVSGLLTRKGPGWVLVATSTGLGVSLLMLAVIPHWVGAGLGKLGILVFTAMWLPAVQVFQMETVDSTWQSVAYGAVSTAMGFGFGIASIFGGYMIASQGYRSLFMAGTLAIAVSMVFLTILLRRHRKSTI